MAVLVRHFLALVLLVVTVSLLVALLFVGLLALGFVLGAVHGLVVGLALKEIYQIVMYVLENELGNGLCFVK
jgi:hypothetical protein